jgi:hypothetical protein
VENEGHRKKECRHSGSQRDKEEEFMAADKGLRHAAIILWCKALLFNIVLLFSLTLTLLSIL